MELQCTMKYNDFTDKLQYKLMKITLIITFCKLWYFSLPITELPSF